MPEAVGSLRHYVVDFEVGNDSFVCENPTITPNDWLKHKYSGEPLDRAPSIVFEDSPGVLGEYLHNGQLLLALRDDLVSLLQSLDPTAFETHPVEMHRESEHEYFYVHTLGTVAGIDRDATALERRIDGIDVFSKLENIALDDYAVAGRHVFRLAEMRTALIMSEVAKDAIEDHGGFDTITFDLVEGSTWPRPHPWER